MRRAGCAGKARSKQPWWPENKWFEPAGRVRKTFQHKLLEGPYGCSMQCARAGMVHRLPRPELRYQANGGRAGSHRRAERSKPAIRTSRRSIVGVYVGTIL